jgi:hypothetical protein
LFSRCYCHTSGQFSDLGDGGFESASYQAYTIAPCAYDGHDNEAAFHGSVGPTAASSPAIPVVCRSMRRWRPTVPRPAADCWSSICATATSCNGSGSGAILRNCSMWRSLPTSVVRARLVFRRRLCRRRCMERNWDEGRTNKCGRGSSVWVMWPDWARWLLCQSSLGSTSRRTRVHRVRQVRQLSRVSCRQGSPVKT